MSSISTMLFRSCRSSYDGSTNTSDVNKITTYVLTKKFMSSNLGEKYVTLILTASSIMPLAHCSKHHSCVPKHAEFNRLGEECEVCRALIYQYLV